LSLRRELSRWPAHHAGRQRPAGPRTTPVISGGKIWTLGTEGHLFCLNASDGKVIWSREFKKDFGAKTPIWGFAANPLLDGNRLICLVGGEGSVAVAFDKDSGKELWRALSAKEPGYCPPMIFPAGGNRQLIIWHPESLEGAGLLPADDIPGGRQPAAHHLAS